MSYTRVIPRDFFNESKLLKCLGHFEIMTETKLNLEKNLLNENEGFQICQDESTGYLFCANYEVILRKNKQEYQIELFTIYNSKEAYPLLYKINHEEEQRVFDALGELTPQFLEIISWHKQPAKIHTK